MRLFIVGVALILSFATGAFAQGWTEYVNKEDGFRVDFPGQPTVAQSTYKSEYGLDLPARVYSIVAGPDQSKTFAFVTMHQNRLYILEGTVPANYPPPGLFQQSMGFIDQDGRGVRYQSVYSNLRAEWPNDFPAQPQRTGQGGRGAGPAAAPAR